jgi:16S rRNA (uracil1498-N3)-methyltransferase
MRRLVVEAGAIAPGRTAVSDDQAHYLREVLRASVGDALAIVDGAGSHAACRIVEIGKQSVVLDVDPPMFEPRDTIRISLIQAVGKRDKMDSVVRQASELGAAYVIPATTERTIAEGSRRVDRWRSIADDALRVSRGFYRTEVELVTTFADVLARPRSTLPLVLALDAHRSLRQRLAQANPLADDAEILIGPEGGLSSEEVAAAVGAGFLDCGLGARTLRTETAGPAALAIVLSWAGALGA